MAAKPAKKKRAPAGAAKPPRAVVSGLLLPDEWDTPIARRTAKRHVRANELLRVIRDHGPLSRIEAARMLGFNARTVSLYVDALVREGLISEMEQRTSKRRGRRPVPLSFNPHAACVMGLDIGRTVTVATVMDLAGDVMARLEEPSDFPRAPERQLTWLQDLVAKLLSRCRPKSVPLAGIGLSPEGIVFTRGATTRFNEEAEWLRSNLEAAVGAPVFVDGDSRLVALGERWFGHVSDRPSSVAVLNVTDGLGLGIMIGDMVYEGSGKFAGELGHSPLGERGIPCFCGSHSCLENIASGQGIMRMAAAAGLDKGGKISCAADVMIAAGSSARARQTVDRFAAGLALGAAMVIDMLNPEVLVISGRLAKHAPVFIDTFRGELSRITVPFILAGTRVVVSELHENAVAIGTCARVLHQIFGTSQVSLRQAL